MSIAIFVPVYNDENTIEGVLTRIPKQIDHHFVTIFVVDDGSSDRSAKIARKFTPNVIRHETNRGVGAATKTGLMAISKCPHFDFIVKLDADGQHDPEMISRVVSKLKRGLDVVVCSRFHPCSDTHQALHDRTLLNNSAASWVNQLTGWNITDARSGFMGFKSHLIRSIVDDIITEGYGIPIELLVRIYGMNPYVALCEIPHPAMYGRGISQKLDDKYDEEDNISRAERMRIAFLAFLNVLETVDFSPVYEKKMANM